LDQGFALPGSRRLGCLLVHGFTATPLEMRPLADALAADGFPVRAVRLAGHATAVTDLARTGWRDWLTSVDEGLSMLAEDVPHVAVAGMSLGALLALHLAATRPDAVSALVLCGTPLRLGDGRVRWLPALARIPWVARRWATIPKSNGVDIGDAAARATSERYSVMPLPALLELLRLQGLVRGELGRVTQPALLLHGRHDRSAPVANVDLLRAGLASRRIDVHVLERSGHVVTLDYDRDEVGRLAAAFLDDVERALTGPGSSARAPAGSGGR